MMLKQTPLSLFLKSFQAPALLWACLIIPSFFTFGKIHFVLPVIYIWTLLFPQKLPWFILFVGGIIQDILLDLTLGTHGLFYSMFLGVVLSQRSLLYNRSFLVKWIAFGLIMVLTQGLFFIYLNYQNKLLSVSEAAFYTVLIPWLLLPLFSQILHTYLLNLVKRYGF